MPQKNQFTIQTIPDTLTVSRQIIVPSDECQLLPDNLTIGGQNDEYQVLPDNLTVGAQNIGPFDECQLLPDNLIEKEALYFPDNIKIDESFDLSQDNLTTNGQNKEKI